MSDEAPTSVVQAREEVVEAFERGAEIYGLNRSYGRLYGILYFADEPLSLDGLVERSGYAKSTVSTAMRRIERLHFVRRRSIPGEGKKVFYEAERDFWRIVQEFLRREVRREIDTMAHALASAAETLESTADEQAERDLEKIRSFERMYEQSESVIDVLTTTSPDRLREVLEQVEEGESGSPATSER